MKDVEFQTQKAFFEWVNYSIKKYPQLALIYAIPNGGKRNIVTAIKLKQSGLKAGIPDVHLPYPCGGYNGLWIEFKAGYNKLTESQAEYAKLLEKYGHRVEVCYTAEAAIKVVEDYLCGI